MIIARPLALAAVVLACVLLAACGSPRGAGEANDYMAAAEKAIGDGDFEEAMVNLKKSIRLDPDKAEPYLKLGLIYEKIKLDEEKAKGYYARYLELEKDEALRDEVREWVRRLDSGGGKDTEAVSEGEGLSHPEQIFV